MTLWLFFDPATECANCPENVFLVEGSETAVNIVDTVINLAGIALIVLVLRSLVRRWRRATRPERRLYAPMYGAGIALMIALIGQLSLQSAGSEGGALDMAFVISLIPFALASSRVAR
jgi:hypothetical protein